MKLRDINNKALYQHGGPNHFLRAALSHWEAQRDEAVATLELYFNGSVGIGTTDINTDMNLDFYKGDFTIDLDGQEN